MKDRGKLSFFRDVPKGGLWKRIVFLCTVSCAVLVAAVTFISGVRWIGKPFPGFLVNQRMVLGGVGQYHWTGTKAGLHHPDKILRADAGHLKSPADLEASVNRVGIGSEIVYTVERGGKMLDVTVRTMRFELFDFLVLYGIFFLVGIFYIIIVSIVFLMKPDSDATWAFFCSFLPLGSYIMMAFDITAVHLGFIRIYMALIWIIPFSLFYLSLVFPEKREIVAKYPAIRQSIIAIPLIMAVPMELSYPGPLYVSLYKVTEYLNVCAAASLIVSAFYSYAKRSSAIAMQRAKVILVGMALAFPIPAFMKLAAALGEKVGDYHILENLVVVPPLVIFPFSVAYGIAKHNMFDVDIFIKRTVGYVIMTVVVGAVYLGLQIGIESMVLNHVFGAAARKITPVLFAFLVVFLFNPLNRRVQDAVDRMFYRKKFDYKATVLSVSDALSSVLDLGDIVRKVVHTVRDVMFIDTSGLVLAGAQGETLRGHFVGDAGQGEENDAGSKESIGYRQGVEREILISANDPLVALVSKERKMITKYDVAEDPRYAGLRETCGKRFEELGASLAVPLLYQGEVKAVLAVGHKKSGQFFTREDIDLLQTLASHGAVAIENANLAEQMKKEETVRTNLSRYLSPQIVDRIVKDDVKVHLGGDRKVVTVLFSDIRNFTTITETRPPDQLVAILNEYFTEMAQIIFEYQGSLDKYIGDAIVAVFGSLILLENPARNAVQASVQMMKRLPILNEKWMKQYDFSMNIGIGVNTGEVFLGNIGSPERMEFTVIGDAVNVASRFSGLAKPGQILVTRDTMAMLGPDVKTHALPPAQVKGKSEILEVYEILGAD